MAEIVILGISLPLEGFYYFSFFNSWIARMRKSEL